MFVKCEKLPLLTFNSTVWFIKSKNSTIIFKLISGLLLVLALGPGHHGLARAFNPRPETSPARDRAGPKKPQPEPDPARKARAGPRAFWIFSCFLKLFLRLSIWKARIIKFKRITIYVYFKQCYHTWDRSHSQNYLKT